MIPASKRTWSASFFAHVCSRRSAGRCAMSTCTHPKGRPRAVSASPTTEWRARHLPRRVPACLPVPAVCVQLCDRFSTHEVWPVPRCQRARASSTVPYLTAVAARGCGCYVGCGGRNVTQLAPAAPRQRVLITPRRLGAHGGRRGTRCPPPAPRECLHAAIGLCTQHWRATAFYLFYRYKNKRGYPWCHLVCAQ